MAQIIILESMKVRSSVKLLCDCCQVRLCFGMHFDLTSEVCEEKGKGVCDL